MKLKELACFLHDPTNAGNLISGSFAFCKPSLYIWTFSAHVLLKPSLKDFEHYLASIWNECKCAVAWTFFGIVFLWDWNENWPLPVPWPLLSFTNLLTFAYKFAYWVQHFSSSIFRPSLVAQTVKNLPAMQETQVWSLGRKDSLKKGMPIHSSILA